MKMITEFHLVHMLCFLCDRVSFWATTIRRTTWTFFAVAAWCSYALLQILVYYTHTRSQALYFHRNCRDGLALWFDHHNDLKLMSISCDATFCRRLMTSAPLSSTSAAAFPRYLSGSPRRTWSSYWSSSPRSCLKYLYIRIDTIVLSKKDIFQMILLQ